MSRLVIRSFDELEKARLDLASGKLSFAWFEFHDGALQFEFDPPVPVAPPTAAAHAISADAPHLFDLTIDLPMPEAIAAPVAAEAAGNYPVGLAPVFANKLEAEAFKLWKMTKEEKLDLAFADVPGGYKATKFGELGISPFDDEKPALDPASKVGAADDHGEKPNWSAEPSVILLSEGLVWVV